MEFVAHHKKYLSFYNGKFQFLQKLRENRIISENSSTLPNSISSMSIHLTAIGKATYEPPGPTKPTPVPTLPKAATDAPMAVLKSEPVKSMMMPLAMKMRK